MAGNAPTAEELSKLPLVGPEYPFYNANFAAPKSRTLSVDGPLLGFGLSQQTLNFPDDSILRQSTIVGITVDLPFGNGSLQVYPSTKGASNPLMPGHNAYLKVMNGSNELHTAIQLSRLASFLSTGGGVPIKTSDMQNRNFFPFKFLPEYCQILVYSDDGFPAASATVTQTVVPITFWYIPPGDVQVAVKRK